MMEARRNKELTITSTLLNRLVAMIDQLPSVTLAAFDEFGSSKSFQMTFLRCAQHIPSKGCGCNKSSYNSLFANFECNLFVEQSSNMIKQLFSCFRNEQLYSKYSEDHSQTFTAVFLDAIAHISESDVLFGMCQI